MKRALFLLVTGILAAGAAFLTFMVAAYAGLATATRWEMWLAGVVFTGIVGGWLWLAVATLAPRTAGNAAPAAKRLAVGAVCLTIPALFMLAYFFRLI